MVWRNQFVALLRSHDLIGIVDGSDAAPSQKLQDSSPNPAYTVWFRKNNCVLSWLLASFTDKNASNLEGHSIQWFCIDQRGMMADVLSVLAAVGITICSCVAEIDRVQGMGVMLFHVEASLDSLVSACSRVDSILGVLGWSMGCSWPISMENQQFLER